MIHPEHDPLLLLPLIYITYKTHSFSTREHFSLKINGGIFLVCFLVIVYFVYESFDFELHFVTLPNNDNYHTSPKQHFNLFYDVKSHFVDSTLRENIAPTFFMNEILSFNLLNEKKKGFLRVLVFFIDLSDLTKLVNIHVFKYPTVLLRRVMRLDRNLIHKSKLF